MLVVGNDVVEVDCDVLQRLRVSGNGCECRLFALEVPSEYAAARVPGEVIAPCIAQCFHVAPLERLESVANNLDLLVEAELRTGFCHFALLEPIGLEAARPAVTNHGPDYRPPLDLLYG